MSRYGQRTRTGIAVSEWGRTPKAVVFNVEYLVVAAGGGGGQGLGGGAGAGGLRSTVTATGGGGTLETALQIGITAGYTVTVGGGGTGGTHNSATPPTVGGTSVFSSITSKILTCARWFSSL